MGIVHQVNLEYLAKVVVEKDGGIYYPTLWWAPIRIPR